ncbi:unnamed protein product [Prorocentrum cordatum]|uniref:Uncharacterized protein n=1 Tax=Prorocentrum cordatum TaxID=2364126 RepID=A0ABN9RAR7_9DINO|nr:unnamed protein product [Polarella glacialis]
MYGAAAPEWRVVVSVFTIMFSPRPGRAFAADGVAVAFAAAAVVVAVAVVVVASVLRAFATAAAFRRPAQGGSQWGQAFSEGGVDFCMSSLLLRSRPRSVSSEKAQKTSQKAGEAL